MYNSDVSGKSWSGCKIGMKKDIGKLQSNWNLLCIPPQRWHFD